MRGVTFRTSGEVVTGFVRPDPLTRLQVLEHAVEALSPTGVLQDGASQGFGGAISQLGGVPTLYAGLVSSPVAGADVVFIGPARILGLSESHHVIPLRGHKAQHAGAQSHVNTLTNGG